MALAHGRTSLKVISDIGAISPGRWQLTQFLYRMAATSLLKVGAAGLLALAPGEQTNAAPKQSAAPKTARRLNFIDGSLKLKWYANAKDACRRR
jgi:hypothetical protein